MFARLFFLLLSCYLSAQNRIWESSITCYDKTKVGYDLQTFPGNMFQKPNGSLIAKAYTQPFVVVGNANTSFLEKKSTITDPALHYFYLKGDLYMFCEWGNIYKLNKNNIAYKIYQIADKSDWVSVEKFDDKVWFVSKSLLSERYQLYCFDGKKLIKCYQSKKYLFLAKTKQNELCLYQKINQNYRVFKYSKGVFKLIYSEIKINPSRFFIVSKHNHLVYLDSLQQNIIQYKNGIKKLLYKIPNGFILRTSGFSPNLEYYPLYKNKTTKILKITEDKVYEVDEIEDMSAGGCIIKNKPTESYYVSTAEKLYRTFPLIKKYPKLFNGKNSNQIYAINQASDGAIWTSSYDGFLNYIEKDKIIESGLKDYIFFHGGLRVGNNMIINTENKGILLFDKDRKVKTIHPTAIGLSNLLSKDSTLYIATANYNIIYAKWKDIVKEKAIWKNFDKKNGNILNANISLIEDKFGNIWSGRSKEGICVFQPHLQKGKSWLIDKKQINFGSATQVLDYKNNLWFGTKDGDLCFYDGKNRDDLSSTNFKKITHPLLGTGKKVSFLKAWNQFIIIGCTDKVLVFDVKEWNENKKVLVRYLHPYEANFSSYTEQNTIVKDFRNNSIWFATNDMVYQWDFQKWINLPTYKVKPKLVVKLDSIEKSFFEINKYYLNPNENTFELKIDYQTLDNLPRLINAQLVKEGEKPNFTEPNFNHNFSYYNLSSGNYDFYIRICQQNGEETIHKFNITIKRYFWEHWWFWFLLSLIPLTFVYFYFKKSRELEAQKKRIAQLNVATVSSQFRPHFMLNALNSLGADLDDKPHAESVISRIGENISLMYDYTQKNKFYFEFEREWKLVLNTIEIQKLMFVKDLSFEVTNIECVPENYLLPMGLLQVCVENALIHGVRHRKTGPWKLNINFSKENDYYVVEIVDNGIGREKSSKLNNFKSKGTGLKNIFSLLKIINSKIENAIQISFVDDIFDDKEYKGTKAIIKLKHTINYELFEL